MALRHALFRGDIVTTGRVETFSDGVLAIVITILVLDLKPPLGLGGDEAVQWHALLEQVPMIIAWIISFTFVLIFWVAHHYLFSSLSHVDSGMLWLNGLFLLFISFTPFPTALAGEYPPTRPAIFLISLAMFLTGASFTLMRWYAVSRGGLVSEQSAPRFISDLKRGALGPVLYAVAMALSFVWLPAAIAIQIGVPALFFLPSRTRR